MRAFSLVLALLALVSVAVAQAQAKPLRVFAAASTIESIREINAMFENAGTGRALAAFGSTGMLAYQIEYGAPADVLISANARWLDHLSAKGLLAKGSRRLIGENSLVLITPSDSTLTIRIGPGFPLVEALKGGRLAIADPAHSPAGAYARAALESLGAWESVARRTARAANVRQALMLVERGQAPAGIVYATDARASKKVRVAGEFPVRSHPRILYEAAIIEGRQRAETSAYLALLVSSRGRAVFRHHGFRAE